MSLEQFLENAIVVEISVVLLILLFIYLLKLISIIKRQYDERQTIFIEDKFKKMISMNAYENSYLKNQRRLDLFMPIVYKFDESYQAGPWMTIRTALLDAHLLPIARKKVKSKKWLQRFWAVKCFELKAEKSDDILLSVLLNDPIPLVQLYAISAAIKLGSPELINNILNQIAERRRLGQTIYYHSLEKINREELHIIADRLLNEKNLYVRTLCYKLLTKFSYTESDLDVTPDIQSENIELKIAGLQYLALLDPNQAVNFAVNSLTGAVWEIRVISLQLLSQLKAETWIDNIAVCLHDSVWWVRLNAAKTLLSFGEKGRTVLNSQDPKVDRFAYETAQFVLKT